MTISPSNNINNNVKDEFQNLKDDDDRESDPDAKRAPEHREETEQRVSRRLPDELDVERHEVDVDPEQVLLDLGLADAVVLLDDRHELVARPDGRRDQLLEVELVAGGGAVALPLAHVVLGDDGVDALPVLAVVAQLTRPRLYVVVGLAVQGVGTVAFGLEGFLHVCGKWQLEHWKQRILEHWKHWVIEIRKTAIERGKKEFYN